MKTLAVIYLDKRRKVKAGVNKDRYHIKILVTFYVTGVRQRCYYKTDVFANEKEYKVMTKGTKDQDLTDKMNDVRELKAKADQIIKDELYLTPEIFENKFTSAGSFKDPLSIMEAMENEMNEEERIGTAQNYRQARSSLQRYIGEGQTLTFAQITPRWLRLYENWCVKQKLTLATVGIYLRPLRAVFNHERGKSIPYTLYPFKEGKEKNRYQIPTGKGRKIALDEDHKNKLLLYKSKSDDVQRAVDFWIFSYFCNGMNLADIAHRKTEDFEDSKLSFVRTKTIKTNRDQKVIVIPVREEVRKIIRKWGNNSLDPTTYLFPILTHGLTAKQIKDRIHDFIKGVNEGLETACEDLKIPAITTYSARHTFATIALRKGASTEFIQEALGHSDPKTTKAYLDGFDFEVKKAISDKL
jgi:integrase/recombinase XerD